MTANEPGKAFLVSHVFAGNALVQIYMWITGTNQLPTETTKVRMVVSGLLAVVSHPYLAPGRERWLDAIKDGYYSIPSCVTYDTWDCPQVLAITGHGATESDELDVKEGDLMNVIVKLSDEEHDAAAGLEIGSAQNYNLSPKC
ncbi:unnamed protein product [Dibothriocephalus latus]|uniref:SH3 domain-containing protein n=1 Tax=Dibothriocephalus latus TaxID=60516 RepID=A0A3P7NMF5_DIBLA|nr:unnamed protein product [Dibothriocephalus latus]